MVATNFIAAAIALAGVTTGVTASPLTGSYLKLSNGKGYNADVTIHASCKGTQERALTKALGEMNDLAKIAANRILKYGSEDELYKKYFGDGEAATVLGYYKTILYGNKPGVLFRCDNIDNKCHQEGWAGHWRTEIAPLETVICPLSFTDARKPLSAICKNGNKISAVKSNYFFASDLMHRLFHVPLINPGERVDHFAGNWTEVTELAKVDGHKAVHNQDSYQYFALDVYGREVAKKPSGCV